MSDPYKVLGISRNASDDEVKKAYRAMSRKYHPDANINNPHKEQAEEMFKLVQQAYGQIMKERSSGTASGSGNYGGFGGFGGFGDFGSQSSQASGEDEETIHLRAAANYIQGGHFREALNVLGSITSRPAMWYYYSAIANSGIGNNVIALDHARTAANMEPHNANYQELLQQLQSGGTWYAQQRTPYGTPFVNGNEMCTRICVSWFMCNLCCGGGGLCCGGNHYYYGGC